MTFAKRNNGWLICFVASLFFCYEMAQLTAFNTLGRELMQTFSLSSVQLSQLSASYLYASAVFLLPAGLLFDRFSTRRILVIVCGLATLGAWLFAQSSSVTIALLGRILIGAGNAFAFLGCMRLVIGWLPANKISLGIGLSVTIAMLGAILAQTPFAHLITVYGWRTAMYLSAAIGVVITVLLACIVQDAKRFVPFTQQKSTIIRNIQLVIANRQNWLCGLYTSLMNLPLIVLGALWGSMYLMHVKGVSVYSAGNITSLIFLGMILGAPTVGWISDKIGSRRKLMIISALALVFVILLVAYCAQALVLLGSLFFVMGFFSSAQILSYPIVAENNATNLESTCLGLVSIIINIVGALAQMLFAWLVGVKNTDIFMTNPYQAALVLLSIAFLLSLIIAYGLKSTNKLSSRSL